MIETANSIVMFNGSALDLAGARRALEATTLTVDGDDQELRVRWADGPVLRVSLERGPGVLAEAHELGAGTAFVTQLQACDARLVIAFDDLGAVLDEVNTLIETQVTLQQATQGILFNTWNDEMSAPESAE